MTKARGKYWNEGLETMPRERLEQLQLELLKEELLFSYKNSPYYKRAFVEAGADPNARINIHDRIDEMLIITGVNVFPYAPFQSAFSSHAMR
jgi:phenylacetate-CoA ligase